MQIRRNFYARAAGLLQNHLQHVECEIRHIYYEIDHNNLLISDAEYTLSEKSLALSTQESSNSGSATLVWKSFCGPRNEPLLTLT